MFDELYTNIGGKLKNFAKWTFIFEAVAAIIAGFIMLIEDEELIPFALLTVVCGPLIAWVSSWLLYAFGELVEKTALNEYNTASILKLMRKDRGEVFAPQNNGSAAFAAQNTTVSSPQYNPAPAQNIPEPQRRDNYVMKSEDKPCATHKWLCDSCYQVRTQTPCEHCGKE